MKRRTFLHRAGLALPALALPPLSGKPNVEMPPKGSPSQYNDEAYWEKVAAAFAPDYPFIQLENGYFSPQAQITLAQHQQYEQEVNRKTSWLMRKEQTQIIESARKELATFLQTDPEQLALVRNTTEAMNTIIMGKNWQKGDEVVIGNQDYGSMRAAFQQISKRYGVVVKEARVPLLPKDDEEIIAAYMSLCTPKTRLLHLTHMINLSGQILPVSQIARVARERGIEVAVDAAHSIAQLNFGVEDLQADYVGASLHKWLSAPLGSGMLWVKRDKIEALWPLMADDSYEAGNIRKLEHTGTRPVQTLMALRHAIAFHHQIGTELKEARLRYLKERWHQEAMTYSRMVNNTPGGKRSCAIANICVKGFSPDGLAAFLYEKYNIFMVAIQHPAIQGVRITPHLFTRPDEIDRLRVALKELAS